MRVMRLAALQCVVACLLVACKPAADAADPAVSGEGDSQAAAQAPSPPVSDATDRQGDRAASGARLQGTVSGLSGTVSGLQGLISDLGGEIRGQEIHVELPADTLFEFDKSDVLPAAQANLSKLAQLINQTQGQVRLIGHTDSKGSAQYNRDLSLRRAQAVAQWLQGHGVPAARLAVEGKGADAPVAANTNPDGSDNPEGRQQNRRVEAIIPKPD